MLFYICMMHMYLYLDVEFFLEKVGWSFEKSGTSRATHEKEEDQVNYKSNHERVGDKRVAQ